MNDTGSPQRDLEPSPRASSGLRTAGFDVTWVFLGPQGLRAGWSVLLFIVIFAALTIFTGSLFAHLLRISPGAPLAPAAALLTELWQFALVFIATWFMSFLEQRPLLFYGYQGQARAARLLSGIAWGFVAISALVFALDKLGYLVIEGRALGGEAALRYAVEWGAVFLLTGFFEESLFRGYLQFTLTRGIGFWWGALLFAVAFGSFHSMNPGETPLGLIAAGAVGLVFCLSLWFTGSLWWAVGFHAAWDWGQSWFYGTADSGMLAQGHLFSEHPQGAALWSGGSTGPEGSVLVLPLLAVIALLMALWWGRRVRSPFAGAAWRPKQLRQTNDSPAAYRAPFTLFRP